MASTRTTDERVELLALIRRIVDECPRRQPASDDERRASHIMQHEFEQIGLATQVEEFKFNDNLYANLALHFGLGSLGTAVSVVAPPLAFALHLLAGASYWADSTRRGYLLRRLLGFKRSQNVIGALPARGEPKLRIVVMAHVDAAFTGLIFNPAIVKKLTASPLAAKLPFLRRSMATATYSQFALAGVDLLRMVGGPLTWPLRPFEHLVNIPAYVSFVAGMDVVLRDTIVPGANDDLSGVAALGVLASRLGRGKPADVEILFVATGCEEASLGGGDALVRGHQREWQRDRTVFVVLDSITNGELRYLHPEGEVRPRPVPEWLRQAIARVAAREPRFAGVLPFEPPVGGSDASACLAHGYDAVSLTCIDPVLGSPRHYHLTSDSPENIDADQLLHSIDFTEQLVREIIRTRRRPRATNRRRAPARRQRRRPASG